MSIDSSMMQMYYGAVHAISRVMQLNKRGQGTPVEVRTDHGMSTMKWTHNTSWVDHLWLGVSVSVWDKSIPSLPPCIDHANNPRAVAKFAMMSNQCGSFMLNACRHGSFFGKVKRNNKQEKIEMYSSSVYRIPLR